MKRNEMKSGGKEGGGRRSGTGQGGEGGKKRRHENEGESERWGNQKGEKERKKEGTRARARARTRVYPCVWTEGDSPHCDCYTHGRNVPPVCAVSCRPATKPEQLPSYCSPLSSSATEQQVAQPSTCPLVCRRAIHTYGAYVHTYTRSRRIFFVRA